MQESPLSRMGAVLSGGATARLAQPVKWIAERGEEFVCSAQGRDKHTSGAPGPITCR